MNYKYDTSNPWFARAPHSHASFTMSDVANCHQHGILVVTGPEIRKDSSHVHCIRIHTSYEPREEHPHWHEVNVITGPALKIHSGGHTHHFAGETSNDQGHRHNFNGVTDMAPDDNYRRKAKE